MSSAASSVTLSETSTWERALAEGLATDAAIVRVSVPAPLVPAERLLGTDPAEAFYWSPHQGFEAASLGTVAVVKAQGPERFFEIEKLGTELLAKVTSLGAGGPTTLARLFGGFAFQNRRSEGALWQTFGEARFVLPRLMYERVDGAASLTLAIKREEAKNPDALRSELARAREALDREPAQTQDSDRQEAIAPRRDAAAERSWASLVEAIRAEIQGGRVEKIVLARCVEHALAHAPDVPRVLSRLREQAPQCTRFMLKIQDSCFLGAAPERLIRKLGDGFDTEAVAGSAPAGEEATLRLFESQKDLGEHQVVVREILRALEPHAEHFEYPRRPEVHTLRHVLHLRTPIRGRLIRPTHVLGLAAELHPTPAVGGVPSHTALEWIATHEPVERGWYAGPVGWFDAAGDGEFVVALRSGLVTGKVAHLYVGAGIVLGSKPTEEFAETEWKLAALAGALGVRS